MITKTYQLNSQKAVSETVDGESIVINLETGNYYSLNLTGSILWNLAVEMQPTKVMVQYFATRYGLKDEFAEREIESFLESLVEEGLLLECDESAVDPEPVVIGKVEEFTPPAFEKYEDMQEMLLADPIHDVNESGWPVLKKDSV